MRQVAWATTARNDLRAIFEYYVVIDPLAADRVVNRILASADSLALVPSTRRSRVAGILEKSVPDTHYFLAFVRTVRNDGDELFEIVRVVHTSLDWPPGKPPPK